MTLDESREQQQQQQQEQQQDVEKDTTGISNNSVHAHTIINENDVGITDNDDDNINYTSRKEQLQHELEDEVQRKKELRQKMMDEMRKDIMLRTTGGNDSDNDDDDDDQPLDDCDENDLHHSNVESISKDDHREDDLISVITLQSNLQIIEKDQPTNHHNNESKDFTITNSDNHNDTHDPSNNEIDSVTNKNDDTKQSDSNESVNVRDTLFTQLNNVFHQLSQQIQNPNKQGIKDEHHQHTLVPVYFIDPTSNAAQSPTTNSNGMNPQHLASINKRRAWNREKVNKPSYSSSNIHELNLYSKVYDILHNTYQSILPNIPFVNMRTNATDLTTLSIRPLLIGAGGDYTNLAHIPELLQDITELHQAPYCYVYIAACSSLDHYRDKVRPALKVFLNQISGTGIGIMNSTIKLNNHPSSHHHKGNSKVDKSKKEIQEQISVATMNSNENGNGVVGGGGYSSQYLILYVPIPSSLHENNTNHQHHQRHGPGFFKRRASHDAHDDSASVMTDTDSVLSSSSNVSHLNQVSKDVKELFKKFQVDFPDGRVSMLSTLLDDDNIQGNRKGIMTNEWREFLNSLGDSVVSEFRNRVDRYHKELQSDKPNSPTSTSSSSQHDPSSWSRYFLIKESLALSYEQMILPTDALREYEEMEASIPSGPVTDNDNYTSIFAASYRGDSRAISSYVRDFKDSDNFFGIIQQYIFSRQLHFLLYRNNPVAILKQFSSFVQTMYHERISSIMKNIEEHDKSIIEALKAKTEAWLVSTCWDFKTASEALFGPDFFSIMHQKSGIQIQGEVREFICGLAELLSFAKSSLLKFGDFEFASGNLAHVASPLRPPDTLNKWLSWEDSRKVYFDRKKSKVDNVSGEDDLICKVSSKYSSTFVSPWFQKASYSEDFYQKTFLELNNVLIQLHELTGQHRVGTYLRGAQAEVHILRDEYEEAVTYLAPTINLCIRDPWDKINSWRLFRLASCQRLCSSPTDYLQLLTFCFGPKLSLVMPSKISQLLQEDLEAVVNSPDISEEQLELSLFLHVSITIEPTSGGRSFETRSGFQKRLCMNSCCVGDDVSLMFTVRSTLAHPVKNIKLKVLLFKIEDYGQILKRGSSCTSEDTAYQVLDLDGAVTIKPGVNFYTLAWTPMAVGQYLLGSVLADWNKATFSHDLSSIGKVHLGFDIVPSNPTQTIELNPIFMIPDHVQDVRLVFKTGSDIVSGGFVELVCCNDGLQVMPPGDKATENIWHRSCTFDLGACEPNSEKVFVVTVKSEILAKNDFSKLLGNFTLVQTLKAKVTTSYHHGLYKSQSHKPCHARVPPPMNALLEAMVTTLERPALTVHKVESFLCSEKMIMISVLVHCNTPISFFLKEWSISLPPPLSLCKDGDLNSSLFEHPVMEDEELFFGFRCNWGDDEINSKERPESNRAYLEIVLEDYDGKTFRQVLSLDIDTIYNQMKEKNENINSIVIAKLTSESGDEGIVGGPVRFNFHFDASTMFTEDVISSECAKHGIATFSPKFLYKISFSEVDWMVAGQVNGEFRCNEKPHSFNLSFIGIPSRPGIITRFPQVKLGYILENPASGIGDNSSLRNDVNVQIEQPKFFKCLAYKNHMALAVSSSN